MDSKKLWSPMGTDEFLGQGCGLHCVVSQLSRGIMLTSFNLALGQPSRWGLAVLGAIAGTLLVATPKPAAADTVVISNGGFSIRTSNFGISVGNHPGYYYPTYSPYGSRTVINGARINNATLNRPVIINSEINNSTLINPVFRSGSSGRVIHRTRVIRRPHRSLNNIYNLQRSNVAPLNNNYNYYPYRY
ncbi:hypothetical protein [Sphaerothrix gracilis]|uniref:hypothetical protein n=1 Tax=Sphaerothrix gracilis TaxID=3151835 RepID=UPI0031FC90DF